MTGGVNTAQMIRSRSQRPVARVMRQTAPPSAPTQAAVQGSPTTVGVTTGTSLRVPVPAGVVAGEILELCVFARSASSNLSGTEAGWTPYLGNTGGGGNHVRFWRVATGSEPVDYGVTGTISTIMVGTMCRISGALTSNPIIASNTGIGAATQPVCPNVNGSTPGNLVLRGCGGFYSPAGVGSAVWDPPATEQADFSASTGLLTTAWELATAASTGTRNVTESKDAVVTAPGGWNASTVIVANGF